MKKKISSIFQECNLKSTITSIKKIGGGCMSNAYQVQTTDNNYFVKINSPDFSSNFKAEFAGLEAIAATKSILQPIPYATGVSNDQSYIIMSYLPSLKFGTADLAKPLARMHLAGKCNQFGFPVPTYCGSTLLDNSMTDQPWSEWFAEHRIGALLKQMKSFYSYSIDDIVQKIITLLKPHDKDVTPSLLHGDLWSGNYGTSDGNPCIYDPAVYYGDPEVDLATIELFGGLGSRFYEDYSSIRPIPPGFEERQEIYNLFHIINHSLMFNGVWDEEIKDRIQKIMTQ